MRIAAAVVLCLSAPAFADIVYTGGTQLSEASVWTDPSPGAPPEGFFHLTGGLEPIPDAVQDVTIWRQTPNGTVRASAGVGYFGLNRDQYTISSEMQSTGESHFPVSMYSRVRSVAEITLDFTITQGGTFEMLAVASNNDLGMPPGVTHTTIRITGQGLSTPILDLDATGYEEVRRFDGFMTLAAGNYSLLLRNEVDFVNGGGAYSRLDFFLDTSVPAPGAAGMFGVGAAVLSYRRRRR